MSGPIADRPLDRLALELVDAKQCFSSAHEHHSILDHGLPHAREDSFLGVYVEVHQDIANEPIAPGALHSGAGEALAEGAVVEPDELDQERPVERGAGMQRLLVRLAGVLVPRADREAIVAAVDPVADGAAREVALFFDESELVGYDRASQPWIVE